MQQFDPKDLSTGVKLAFTEARSSALKFAENFLIDPTLGTPFRATYPQKFILSSKKRDLWVCIHRRAGKAQPLDSIVYTPTGPVEMGSLKIGDVVCTPDGGSSTINAILPQGTKSTYRFTLDDGTIVDSSPEHEWEVYTGLGWKGKAGESRKQFGNKTLTSREIYNTYIYSYSTRIEFQYKLNPILPIKFEKLPLPIDPYLLGVLLGDGCLRTLEITSADPEIIDKVAKRTNIPIIRERETGSMARRYFLKGDNLYCHLEDLKLKGTKCHTKFIPETYLHSDVESRTQLLQGLMDTDGSKDTKTPGSAEFCSVSKQLAYNIVTLARSLGCKASVKSSNAVSVTNGIRKTTGIRYRVNIRVPEGLEIFSLERKKCGFLPERYLRRTIVKVELLPSVEMQCISIDHPDHLYITDNFTPTHNCVIGDTLVLDPVSLKPTPISKAVNFKKTLCFDFNTNQTVWAPCTWIQSGVKKCLKLEMGSGVDIGLSDDHPVFCSKRGWVTSSQIRVGDRILAPTTLEVFGDSNPERHMLELDIDFSITYNRMSNDVYKYTKEALTIFLREFFLAKGRILHSHNCVVFMLWNRDFSLDLRHLLGRFGIDSRIDNDGNLFIDEDVDKSKFLNSIGLEHVVTEVRSPRKWETVTNIKHLGPKPVYDLSIEHPDHNFIGNDMVLHNSYALSILALWHAIIKNDQKIAIFAPSSVQINEIFDVIDKWIVKNPFLAALQDPSGGNHKNPQKRTFVNGSTIQGYLMGISGSLEGAKRGITADIILNDESQLFDEDDWRVVTPIMSGDKFRAANIRTYTFGTTPDNPTNFYYEKIYKMNMQSNEDKIFFPITKNPDYSPQMIEDIRVKTPPNIWTTEYLLELGEVDLAVFRKQDITMCSKWDWEYGIENIDESKVRFIGVDWDKVQAGTNIAVFQYDPFTRITQVIYREEVERDKFTYLNAVTLILQLFDVYTPELVIADQGQGEVQWELLQMESERQNSGLAARLVKKAFNEKIEVPNPQTGEIDKHPLKPFLVGMLQKKMQENQFRLPAQDETLINQLLAYRVTKTTLATTKYSTHNEHIIDCCLFCMYGIWYLYENDLEKKYGSNNSSLRIYNDQNTPINQFQEDSFWNTLEGPRVTLPSHHIPRTSFDDPFRKPGYDLTRDFFRDD